MQLLHTGNGDVFRHPIASCSRIYHFAYASLYIPERLLIGHTYSLQNVSVHLHIIIVFNQGNIQSLFSLFS